MLSILLGSDGGPWGHGWGAWPPGTWMRPVDAMDGLSGKFWAATAYLRETLLGIDNKSLGCHLSSWGLMGGPWGHSWGTWLPGT